MTNSKPKLLSFILIGVTGIVLSIVLLNNAMQEKAIVQGSFTNKPQTEKESVTASSHSLNPIHSNQWYSTIYKSFPSNPMYAYPLAYKIEKNGLSVSYPEITSSAKTVFAPFTEDILIGFESNINRPKIAAIGDWNVQLQLKSVKNDEFSVNLMHGAPSFVINANTESNIKITSKNAIKFYQPNELTKESKNTKTKNIVLRMDKKYYLVSLDQEREIKYSSKGIDIVQPKKIVVSLVDKPENIDTFLQYANTEVTNTSVSQEINSKELNTTYTFDSTNNDKVLTTLLPHQFDNLINKVTPIGEYTTLRGKAKLVALNAFTTSIPAIIPNQTFIKATTNESEIKAQLKKDIEQQLKEKAPDSKNYFLGTWFGKVTSLIQLAEVYGLTQEKQKLVSYVTPIFTDSLKYYKYDNAKYSFVSLKPEFGNDELNDHHFHYGYYIRMGAILLGEDVKEKGTIEENVGAMVNDIANTDRSSDEYPYIRNFDTYEGHSWADGYGDASDGNNQESTSEAINAWYSIYLWGKQTNDVALQNTGLYLYNTEVVSTMYYWFDTADIYKEPYKYKIASIVWGGKVDFATWFSKETNMIYGIQLLPITPASDYLAAVPNFDAYEKDFINADGSLTEEWAEFFLVFKSYHKDVAIKDIPKNLKPNDRMPKSLLLHMVSTNSN
ncbi:MAG: hypothetical protein H0W89_02175 [Candidatus Levybacteria bacterium]|nr:hypothetical protein [Candidatus Levybacteria bacterium]